MHGEFEPLKLLNKKTTAEFLEKKDGSENHAIPLLNVVNYRVTIRY